MKEYENSEHLCRDKRPQHKGWSPGTYKRTCCFCKIEFYGDKRAMCCADCGYDKNNWKEQA